VDPLGVARCGAGSSPTSLAISASDSVDQRQIALNSGPCTRKGLRASSVVLS
jgi:hypothetical protein